MRFSLHLLCLQSIFLLWAGSVSSAQAASLQDSILSNPGVELDANMDQWPDAWPKGTGILWGEEGGNRYLRMQSTTPGKLVMAYREIAVPEGVRALKFSWKQRITNLQRGEKAWFNARILFEFMDGDRKKLTQSPKPFAYGKDQPEWVTKEASFLVPEGARIIKFMPCLFNVKAGTYDLDDLVLTPIDPTALLEAAALKESEQALQQQSDIEKRQAKAKALLDATGSLISNGNFESTQKNPAWPDHWGQLKENGSYENEAGDHFVRMKSTEPGKLIMLYREIDLPSDVKALKLSWRWRVTDLKVGEKPWFDARVIAEILDADGKKLKPQPSPSYSRGTDGWVHVSRDFLVPEGAVSIKLMPALFSVASGTMDIDDIKLEPTDTQALEAAAAKRAEEARMRYVAPEEPQKENWPLELHTEGNRLVDSNGEEVWLQGLNAGNLETLPHDTQVIKSAVVGIEEWNANVIRLPVKEEFWYGTSVYQKDGGQGYRDTIDQIVTLVANRGAYLVLDLHRYRAPKPIHAQFWVDAATHFKNHPAVLFDLMNEPHGISWEVWRNGGWVGTKTGVDESGFLTDAEKKANQGYESVGMQGLLDAVRSTGARNIVVVGGIGWSGDLSGVVQGYALDEHEGGNGIMYSWHQYNWHTGWAKTVLPVAEQYPILVGEVGADTNKMDFIPHEIQESPYTWVPDMLGFIQKYRLNWTAWCFHPRATPVLIKDWTYEPTEFWGVFAKEALHGKQFEMKRMR
ncbi:cellulase family glycosylhydrolase [Coraliomargarita sp. SDUM461003]|uniref:Cellulase family glycosylhydrolase n=1 Tax=Thalassobacterium maritimum TaxID=3041265 RepID=A0ABU1AXM6_9BACT|nr:cellulase family glycosylhydrolase [Coraliomargarita sp. SDUM461003]MDQ8207984.1 cellulase family glycosylhydrolase [Coraliomargarita sp. SDUM461003]